jgi:hypothetical protein
MVQTLPRQPYGKDIRIREAKEGRVVGYGVQQQAPEPLVRKLNDAGLCAPNPRYEPMMKRITRLSTEDTALLLDHLCVIFMNDEALWDTIACWLA